MGGNFAWLVSMVSAVLTSISCLLQPLGRLDGVAFFRPLALDDIRKIAVLALNKLAVRVTDASGGRLELRPHSSLIDIAVEDSVKSPQYGARGVQRAVQRKISIPLSKCATILIPIPLCTTFLHLCDPCLKVFFAHVYTG